MLQNSDGNVLPLLTVLHLRMFCILWGKLCILLKVYKVFVAKTKDFVQGVAPAAAAIPEVVSPQGTYFNVSFDAECSTTIRF